MGLASTLPSDQRIEPLDKLAGLRAGMPKADADRAVDAYLDRVFAGTKLADSNYRMGLIEKNTADLMATKDSFIAMAAALEPLAESIRETGKERAGAYARLRPRYMEAMLVKAGGLVAPDANSTLRVSFAHVKGYTPRDGVQYSAQTTLAGMIEKNTGAEPFAVPQFILEAAQKATPEEIPLDFLSDADTTGGNSGSPVINARGELVGLNFDRVWENVANDFGYNPAVARNVNVDIRFFLWLLRDVQKADWVLKELGQ